MYFSNCELLIWNMCWWYWRWDNHCDTALNKNWLIHSAAFLQRKAEMNAFSSNQDQLSLQPNWLASHWAELNVASWRLQLIESVEKGQRIKPTFAWNRNMLRGEFNVSYNQIKQVLGSWPRTVFHAMCVSSDKPWC